MIITLPTADFSNNNIGQIDVPIVWDTDATSYLAAIPVSNAAMTDAKKRAINTFFKHLKSAGIYSKITHIFLPVFGQNEGGVNLINPSFNVGFPTANATYDSNGILLSQAWSTGITSRTNDLSMSAYNTTAVPTPTDSHQRISLGIHSGSTLLFGRGVSNNNSLAGLILTATDRVTVANKKGSIGTLIGSMSLSEDSMLISVDGEISAKSGLTYTNTSFALELGGNIADGESSLSLCSFGLIHFGSYLTSEEVAVLNALQVNLMTTLLN